jgi:glycosyltransferase involved in cell wall biosynthesis
MRFSVVTISFNQAKFLERAILSVLEQKGVDLEYIVVDPGSTDGSRDIIERYRTRIAHVVFEKDQGPADGLNMGFARATGAIYGYLNADDMLELGALQRVATFFELRPDVDVICGHCWIVDPDDKHLRRAWSEPFTRLSSAYGAAVQIQPSTFFRQAAFRRTKGFNVENRSNWDGELLVDLFLSGARIEIIDAFLSYYRLHEVSITNSGTLSDLMAIAFQRRFEKLMGRKWNRLDSLIALMLRAAKHIRNPQALAERLALGPVYLRGVK